MRNLLYYPSFEIRNKEWLKFALLYLKNLNIIIPESADRHLSAEFNEIYNQTDLFRRYRPNYDSAYYASLDAIETLEPILRNPSDYSYGFNISKKNETIVDQWRNLRNHNFELYEEKFSNEFFRFCYKNGFCQHSPNGILVPRELSLIYMSILAQAIGNRENLAPITDINRYDFLSNILRSAKSNEEGTINLARNVIEVKIPANLNRIDINDIINLRSDRGFNQSLDAFHNSLNEFQSSIENGNITQEYLERFEHPFQAISEEVKKLSLDLASYTFGSWIILSNADISIPAFIKDIIIGGLTTYTTNRKRFKGIWNNINQAVRVRKYYAYLKKLWPPRHSIRK